MNKDRRNRLAKLNEAILDLRVEAAGIAEEEREAFEALPEGLQMSSRGEELEASADALDAILDDIDRVMDAIEEAVSQ